MPAIVKVVQNYTPIKRKVLHFIFWSILLAMYLVSYNRFDTKYSWLLAVKEIFAVTSIFYFTSYYIIPKFVLKGRYLYFLSWLILIYFWWGLLTYSTCYLMNINIHPSKRLQSYVDHVIHMGLIGLFKYDTFTFYFLDFIYFISLPLGIKLTKSILSIGNEKTLLEFKNLELELSNVQLELAFLKLQINPHFLFNTINNIIFLVSEDTALAEKSLAQLSRIMNYLVYESDKKTVPLDSEFSFLRSYIQLEKIRLSSKVKTTININSDSNDYTIVPLIIFPFVENAFKHGPMSSSRDAWVDIQISSRNHILDMQVSNGFRRIEKPVGYVGGIGIDNVYKRLELNYPKQYNLTITEAADSYIVVLKLSLNGNEFSDINL